MSRRPTQKDKVRRILLDKGFITNHECIEARLTTRLGAIIHTLRNEGMEIAGEFVEGSKDFKYTLVNRPPKMVPVMVEKDGIMHMRMVPETAV